MCDLAKRTDRWRVYEEVLREADECVLPVGFEPAGMSGSEQQVASSWSYSSPAADLSRRSEHHAAPEKPGARLAKSACPGIGLGNVSSQIALARPWLVQGAGPDPASTVSSRARLGGGRGARDGATSA